MRITNSHRGHTTNLAKCTKMTEGEHRIHGMNGVTDSGSAATTEESPHTPETYNLGGRLKFFKNGRFILELARAREGEKVAWVPVPKKTFWPPQGSASSVSTYRQESSTSLSVSDDNSSVQSSPWQRDHTWKQTSPQRNVSNHLSFYYWAPRGAHRSRPQMHRCVHRLQRAPYSPTPNSIAGESRTQCNKCNTTCVSKSAIKPSLVHIVQLLWNKSLQALNSITSPRKRILRELERVTIDDLSLKRCRGKVAPNAISKAPTPTSESVVTVVNGSAGVEEQCIPMSSSAKNCSYSITSLLGKQESRDRDRDRERERDRERDRDRDDKLSSQNTLASKITSHHRTATVAATAAVTAAPVALDDSVVVVSAANATYGQDAVDGITRAAELMCNKRSAVTAGRSPSLSASPTVPVTEHYAGPTYPSHPTHPPHPTTYVPYHVYGMLGTPPPSLYYNAFSRGYYPGPGPGYLPPHTPHPQPYSWSLPPTSYPDHTLHTDDSDVPLNLSKHAD